MDVNESILTSIKKLLGISADYTHFDPDIIIHINSVFSILYQLGVGPKDKAYAIADASNIWSEFLVTKTNIESVKSYVYCKVRLIFDPPTASSAMEAAKDYIHEFEWRLNVEDDDTVDYDSEMKAYDEEEGVNWGD